MPYKFGDILLSAVYLVTVCNSVNGLLSKLFRARTNMESASITALILTLIIGPLPFFESIAKLTLIGSAAMAAKYILAVRKRHIFNPAAAGALFSALILGRGASWWVGGEVTLLVLLGGGFLILAKTRRVEVVVSFLAVYLWLGGWVFPTKVTGFLCW